jgi:hypothetical protein
MDSVLSVVGNWAVRAGPHLGQTSRARVPFAQRQGKERSQKKENKKRTGSGSVMYYAIWWEGKTVSKKTLTKILAETHTDQTTETLARASLRVISFVCHEKIHVPKSAAMLIFCAMTSETSVFKIFPLFT